jgi:hypothetical protein
MRQYLPSEGVAGPARASLTLSTLIAFSSIWVAFDRRRLALRCVLCAMLVGLASAIQASAVLWLFLPWFAFAFSVYTAWLIASFLDIRWAGYRLEWRWRFGRRQDERLSEQEPS